MKKITIFIASLITICIISVSISVVLFMKYKTLQTSLNNPKVTITPSLTISKTVRTTVPKPKPVKSETSINGVSYGRSYSAGDSGKYTQGQVDEIISMYEERLAGLGGDYKEETTTIQMTGEKVSEPVIPQIPTIQNKKMNMLLLGYGLKNEKLEIGYHRQILGNFGIAGITDLERISILGSYRWGK
ncbi:hypothetical protein C0389_06850 [bacterium]|nr:hypothetical protein [bacterium]